MFDAGLEQHLQADADGQHGTAAGDAAADHADGVNGLEFAHDGFEGADAGDDEAVGVEDVFRLGAEDDFGAGPLQRADGGADIARSRSPAP